MGTRVRKLFLRCVRLGRESKSSGETKCRKRRRGERMRRYGVPVVRLEFLSLFASDFASGRRSRCMYVPSEGLLPFRDRLGYRTTRCVLVCLVCVVCGLCRLWFSGMWGYVGGLLPVYWRFWFRLGVMCSLAAWDRSGWRDDGVPKADELSSGESESCTRRHRVRRARANRLAVPLE